MSTPDDEYVFALWDEKQPVRCNFILGPPYTFWSEANRKPHGYASMIGETFMYARDNMGIGVRTA